eukprot:15322269-Ditylum_brightwellii.AAC.1
MLQPCRHNPKLSACIVLEGPNDHNAHPLAPLGTEKTLHETSEQQISWSPDRVKGWYTEPSREHYRCYHAYILSTRGEQIAGTVDFHTTTLKLPHVSPADADVNAAKYLMVTLKTPHKDAPFLKLGMPN